MPVVRIDLRKGKDAAYRQQIGRVVYEALVGVGVRKGDRKYMATRKAIRSIVLLPFA